jgi:hypothetical protein
MLVTNFRPLCLLACILMLSLHLHIFVSPSGIFPAVLQTKKLFDFLISSVHSTCPTYFVHRDMITLTVFSHSSEHHVTFFLGSNILNF